MIEAALSKQELCGGAASISMIELLKEWTRRAPKELERRLVLAGGTNLFDRPNFRLIWASGRLEWQGGRWNDFDEQENRIRSVVAVRHVPRYEPFEGWIVEKWVPPETYGTRENWNRQFTELIDGIAVQTLGPYPSEGDYEEIFRLAAPLTPTICDALVRLVSQRRSLTERKQSAEERQAKKEGDWQVFADDVLRDALVPDVARSGYGEKRRPGIVSICEKLGIAEHPF